MSNVRLTGVDSLNDTITGMISIFKAGGRFTSYLKKLNASAYQYARRWVHKDTRSLFRAIRRHDEAWRGRIYLDWGVKNPTNRTRPAEYGYYENRRGGKHAFMNRTAEFMRKRVVSTITEILED